MFKRLTMFSVACCLTFMSFTVLAQGKKTVVVDPAKTGPDYAIQGEYVGTLPGLIYSSCTPPSPLGVPSENQ